MNGFNLPEADHEGILSGSALEMTGFKQPSNSKVRRYEYPSNSKVRRYKQNKEREHSRQGAYLGVRDFREAERNTVMRSIYAL